MAPTTIEKIAAELQAIRQLTFMLNKNLRTAIVAIYSGNIIAARIQSAKTNCERNEAIRQANEILEAMKKSLAEDD